MLFIIIVLVITLVGATMLLYYNKKDRFGELELFNIAGAITTVFGTFILVLALISLFVCRLNLEAQHDALESCRESLVYQLEHNLYINDNDNDTSLYQLYSDIQVFNKDLVFTKKAHESIWVGAYFPIEPYEGIEPIDLP